MSARTKQVIFVGLAVVLIGFAVVMMRPQGGAVAPSGGTITDGAPASSSAVSGGQTQVDPAITQRISTLQDQVKNDPQDVKVLVELGALLFQSQQFARAADIYNKALDIDPANNDVRLQLGVAYFYQGMSGTAIREIRKVIDADPKQIEPHYQLAIALSHGDPPDIDGAIAEWQEVIKLAPDSDIAKRAQTIIDGYQKQK
ncbi:MAG: tetratricopeptide repeat protein [Chloroflexi bacterium]|nr:tetratricopeptide repeat protein [Chloroflexota bacterium]